MYQGAYLYLASLSLRHYLNTNKLKTKTMINKLITLKEVKSRITEAEEAIKIQAIKSSKAQLKKYKLKNNKAKLTRYKKGLENELKDYLYKKRIMQIKLNNN